MATHGRQAQTFFLTVVLEGRRCPRASPHLLWGLRGHAGPVRGLSDGLFPGRAGLRACMRVRTSCFSTPRIGINCLIDKPL